MEIDLYKKIERYEQNGSGQPWTAISEKKNNKLIWGTDYDSLLMKINGLHQPAQPGL